MDSDYRVFVFSSEVSVFVRRIAVLAAVAVVLLSGCSSGGGEDELQTVANPTAAVAQESPKPTRAPDGEVVEQRADVAAMTTVDGTLAVAVDSPPSVLLYDLDALGAKPRRVELPSKAASLRAGDGAVLAALPDAGRVARVAVPDGAVSTVAVRGKPVAATTDGTRTLVATRGGKGVAVITGGRVTDTITGDLYSADDVLTTGGKTVVLDRLRTALFDVDVDGGAIEEGLRAGMGATNAVTDSFGRVLVTDTRGGGLLAFSTDPLLLRQRYPVSGGVYGIAYDAKRHLAWVTLTGRNEVVAYDVRGGEPVEKFRRPTVRQPDSVTVDARTSRVVVGSAAGEGIQVITP